jgi:hypothetical protein
MITANSNLVKDINGGFTILKEFITADALDNITTSLMGDDLVNALNGNYSKLDIEAPSTILPVSIGMTGSQLINTLNANNTAKASASGKTYVNGLLSINDKIIAWYDALDLSTVTKDGSNIVSRCNDKLGSGKDLTEGSCSWDSDSGFTFNGSSHYLKSSQWDFLTNPCFIYLFVKQHSPQGVDKYIFDSYSHNYCGLMQSGGNGELNCIRAIANGSSETHYGLGLGEWGIVKILYNGANSVIKVNDYVDSPAQIVAPVGSLSWNSGNYVINGLTLGSNSSHTEFSNVSIQEMLIVNSELSESDINEYLKDKCFSKYRFNEGKIYFQWDGDFDDIYTGHQIINSLGIDKSSVCLCTHDMVDSGNSGNLTWDEIAIMESQGCDIQCHGYGHTSFTDMTEQQLLDNLDLMVTAITTHGHPTPIEVTPPYGYSDKLSREVISRNFSFSRASRPVILEGLPTYYYELPTFGLGLVTEQAKQDFKDLVDKAKLQKSILIVYCHGVAVDSGMDPTTFTELMTYAKDNLTFISTAELYALIST